LASPVAAQQPVPGQTSVSGYPADGDPAADDIHTRSIFDNRNFMIRTDAGDGVGYLRGYQTFAAFQPIIAVPDELVFWMSPRGYVTYNSGSFAGNLGTGVRWLNPGTQRILGGGAWWDHDNNGTNNYDQLGGSLEWLGNYFDLRANAYIPTNQNVHLISKGLNGNNVFIMNNIGVGQTTITNSALRGGDFEAGGALPFIGDMGLRAYAGGYYLQGPASGGGIYGVRARAEALITQDVWGTVAVSHDRTFGTNVTAAATIYLFTGNQQKFFGRIPMQTRLYQQQERQYRVAVEKDVENDTILALRNGGTGGSGGAVGSPIFVLHVDNTAPGGGNGTVEHPLNFLPTTTASNVDIVFVHRGDGTSNMMNQGITLNNFERLLGQGVQHQFTDTMGTFTLPGFSAGPLPSITNLTPGGSAVTLASHNEVSGFNINGAALHGITGTNVVDFNINNVFVSGSGNSLGATPVGAGIQLTNATGTGSITQSNFNNNNAEGIRIDNSAGGTLNLRIANVHADNNLTGIELNATGSAINPTVTNTTANGNRHDGISISLAAAGPTRSTTTGVFDQVQANSNNTAPPTVLNFGNGFAYNSSASDGTITITRSEFNSNQLNGLSFTTTNNSTLNATLLNNNQTISSNVLNGVLFTNTDSQVTATLLNNVINSNGGFGIDIVSKGTGAFATSFNYTIGGYLTQDTNGNGQLDPGENNVAIPSLGPTIIGNGVFNREGNTIIGNHGAGIAIALLDQGTASGNIIGNLIQSTGAASPASATYTGQGIDLRLTGSSVVSNSTASFTGGTIDANTIGSLTNAALGNAGAGIVVFANQNTSLQNLVIGTPAKGNIIAHNGGDGVNITRGNTAQVGNITPVSIDSANIQFNTGNGVSIQALNSFNGIVNGFVIANSTISNNTQNGILLHVEADAQMNVNIIQNTISHNPLDGIQVTELTASAGDLRRVLGQWSRNTITFNGLDGINLAGATGSVATPLEIGSTATPSDGNIISNNGAHGIFVTAPSHSDIGFNTIDSNATGGIYLHALPVNTFVIHDNVITNNGTFSAATDGGDGIQIVNGGNFGGIFTASDTISNNTIRDNAGRGVNILNQNGGLLTVDLESNIISNNRFEGIYVVNTASAAQSADALSTAPMDATGSLFTRPRLTLTVNNNDIEGNGISSGTSANGLVIRVGTSDSSGANFSDDGGFFANGRGGVGATVTNNTFHGNLGDDVSFSSFTSTVNPVVTAGTWDTVTFSITTYEADPLARLDLSFHNNTFDSTGLNAGNTANVNPRIVGANFNDNNEEDFKSRENDSTPPGPFIDGERVRNAERLAGRFLGVLDPSTPQLAPTFRFSGIGQSTFRLLDASNGGATTAGDVAAAGFITDVNPYLNPFTDARGVVQPSAFGNDMPFGWTLGTSSARPQ
jgi:hypothetical protein